MCVCVFVSSYLINRVHGCKQKQVSAEIAPLTELRDPAGLRTWSRLPLIKTLPKLAARRVKKADSV